MTIGPNGRPLLGISPALTPVSNSEMKTYKGCKRQWWLAYYRGYHKKARSVVGPLPLGTRIHSVLEAYYTDHADPLRLHAQLVEKDRNVLLAHEQDTADFDKEADLGRIMLEGYLNWLEETGADADLEVVAAEEKLSMPLLDGTIEVRGKLDMRVRRKVDNVRLFMDHKTTANFADLTRMAHMDEQLMLYLMLELLQPDEAERCDGGIFNMLKKVKRTATARPPFYDRLEVHFNKHTMNAFWLRLHGTIQNMVATRQALDAGYDHHLVAYPSPTRDCTWKCEFFQVCPMFDDGSAAEEMLENYYEVGDPYARYEKDPA